jgi:hypothetical protein
MDEQQVRERAEAVCAALVSGDIPRVSEDVSKELRSNLGEVLALLPLPVSEATVESVEHGGRAADVVIVRLVGENEEVRIQTRWKDRGGRPTIVEVSHLSRSEAAPSTDEAAGAADADEDQPA